MANKINFITGETYTLSELFSGKRRIIIPDLQRDYCWGNDNNILSDSQTGELVSAFIENLIEQYLLHDNSSLNLGLFYGYEVPANHIQLCDGQQRLTTLYILLGVINRRTLIFRRYLISDYEYMYDDKEPYLNYAIRESSLYFLSDLVCNFFIDKTDSSKIEEETIEEIIKTSDWYFSDYDLDPSIQSIIKAISKIDFILRDKTEEWLKSFGDWLLNKVTFLYFDMENRKNGEETFVVINTTGESLSSAQNLKPLVIEANKEMPEVDKKWEEIETWFWRKRLGDNDTADAGFAEFLRWVNMIENYKQKESLQLMLQCKGHMDFPYKNIQFSTIEKYWKSLKWIYENENIGFEFDNRYLSPQYNKNVNGTNAIEQNDCFVLLPVLKYVCNITTNDGEKLKDESIVRNIRRVYEFFNNLIRIENVSKAVNSLVYEALNIVDLIKGKDILTILEHQSEISKQIFTDEEIEKLEILQKAGENRNQIEELFWKAQSHKIYLGEITPLIHWSYGENNSFDYDKCQKIYNLFNNLFHDEMDYQELDITRRALLTQGLKEYPKIFRGYTNYSFCWEYSDWKILILENIDIFKKFIESLLGKQDIDEKQKNLCENYSNTNDENYEFIKQPELLEYCKQKNAQWDDERGWILIKGARASGGHACLKTYLLHNKFLKKIKNKEFKINNWAISFDESGQTTICFERPDSQPHKATIDIAYKGKDKYILSLWTDHPFEKIAKDNNMAMNLEVNKYELDNLSEAKLEDKTSEIMTEVENIID